MRLGPVLLPLNYDPLTELTIVNRNSASLISSYGTLNNLGRATATFKILPTTIPATLGTDWAFVSWDPRTFAWTWASNAVPLQILR